MSKFFEVMGFCDILGDIDPWVCALDNGPLHVHYNDVIMSAMASQITSLTIAYSSIYSGADQGKHQRSASLALVRGIHRWPVNSPHKGPVTQKMLAFHDVIMRWLCARLRLTSPLLTHWICRCHAISHQYSHNRCLTVVYPVGFVACIADGRTQFIVEPEGPVASITKVTVA